MRKRFAAWIAGLITGSLILTLSCIGWGETLPAGLSPAPKEEPSVRKIAVLTYSFSSEYWGYVAQGCLAYGENDPAIDVTVEGVSSSIAAGEQAAMLSSDLEYGRYDGYVIAPIDEDLIKDKLKNIRVPVVSVDSPVSSGSVIGWVGTNNQVAAAAGAKKAVSMAKELGWERPDCVMIGGIEEDYNHISRLSGYRSGIQNSGAVWTARVYPTDKSADKAREAMDQIMKDYPDGVAIVACYNDVLAEAALSQAEGNKAFDNTVFVGFDGNGSVCERIMNDDRYENMITIAQNPYEMGFSAVKMLADYMNQSTAGASEGSDLAGKNLSASAGAGPGSDESESGEASVKMDIYTDNYIDSGYAIITKVNSQERMVQIRNHLS